MTVQPSEIELAVPTGGVGGDEFGAPSKSQARQALDLYRHSATAMAASVVFFGVVLLSYIYPHFYKWKYNFGDVKALSVSPGTQGHILGTDETGFDLLSRLMRGTQRDFVMMVVSTVIALVIGISVGAVAGYFGRFADNLLMRFVDVMLTVPSLVILIVAASRFSIANTAPGLGVIFGIFGWMGLSRLVRAQFLSLREREFVEAAHAMGASNFRIIFRHMIPNTLSTILVFATLFAASSIVAETSVTYLGYGIKAPDTSLGLLISKGVDAAETRPWLFYFPGILILIIVLAVNLMGEGIRNAFDPRHNRVRD